MLHVRDLAIVHADFSATYTLDVPRGALCALVGPSGGGKTTLLSAIAGFEPVRGGTLTFEGRDLLPLAPARRPVALLFQDFNLFPHLTAAQNVGLGIRPDLRLGAQDGAQVQAALGQMGLAGFGARLPAELSGGERQRVALARALVMSRPLLLLDEPFGALDPGLRRSMIALVDRLRRERGLTVLMSIHTPEEIAGVADQLVFIAKGRVLASGAPRAVLDLPLPELDAFLGRGAPAP